MAKARPMTGASTFGKRHTRAPAIHPPTTSGKSAAGGRQPVGRAPARRLNHPWPSDGSPRVLETRQTPDHPSQPTDAMQESAAGGLKTVAPGGSPGVTTPPKNPSPPGHHHPISPAIRIRAGDTTIARNRRPGLERESVEHDIWETTYPRPGNPSIDHIGKARRRRTTDRRSAPGPTLAPPLAPEWKPKGTGNTTNSRPPVATNGCIARVRPCGGLKTVAPGGSPGVTTPPY